MKKDRKKRRAGESRSTSVRRGFVTPFAGDENYELGRRFMRNPQAFLSARGLTTADLACPPEVHKALERGEKFAKAARKIKGPVGDPRTVSRLKALAARHMGKDFEVAAIPFGLKFKEKLPVAKNGDWTATGSGTLTFLDGDGDVDG